MLLETFWNHTRVLTFHCEMSWTSNSPWVEIGHDVIVTVESCKRIWNLKSWNQTRGRKATLSWVQGYRPVHVECECWHFAYVWSPSLRSDCSACTCDFLFHCHATQTPYGLTGRCFAAYPGSTGGNHGNSLNKLSHMALSASSGSSNLSQWPGCPLLVPC